MASMLLAHQALLFTLQQRPAVTFSFTSLKSVITAAWKRYKPQFQFHHPLHFSLSQCSVSSLSRLTSLHLLCHSPALQADLKGFVPVTFISLFSPPSIGHYARSLLPFFNAAAMACNILSYTPVYFSLFQTAAQVFPLNI